ncbi:hypothetical protein [Streptomyces sp. NPDC018711]
MGAADKAYPSRGNRAYLRKRNIKAAIPDASAQAVELFRERVRRG